MGSILSWISRGRGLRSGLVIVFGTISACRQGSPPGRRPVDGYQEPSISQQDGWTLIENTGPAEDLLIYDDLPEKGR